MSRLPAKPEPKERELENDPLQNAGPFLGKTA